MKKSFALITLGAILEYYDFAIFIYFAKNIGESLIPIHNETANLIASFGVLAIGALLRPLGGTIFAHFGDTRGRKNIFVYTVLMMALPTFMIGLIPSYAQIGIGATIILILLRCIQGLAIGGEIPGSVVFAYELSSKQNKALNTNIVIAGTNIGFFAASMLGAILLKQNNLPCEAWRIAFFIGGTFGVISYYLRKNLMETPEFSQYQQFINKQPHPPVKELWLNYKKPLFQMLAFGSLLASSLAVFTFFMPTYLATYYKFPMDKLLKYNSYSIIIFVISAFIAGKYHCLFAKKFLLIGTFIFVGACYYLFSHYQFLTLNQIILYHYIVLIFIGIICGRLPVLSASFFPVQVRYSGVGLSYNISFGIVAGLTQIILFALIKYTGVMLVPAIYITIFALFAVIFLLTVDNRQLVEYN
jgi:MFS family permease